MTFQRRPIAVRAFDVIIRISNALSAWPTRIVPPPFRLIQIGTAFWQSRVLYLSARLDIATVLADRHLSVVDLATEVGAEPDAMQRLLRMLAAMGVFNEVEPGVWRNNKLSNPLRSDHPDSVRALILMHNSPAMSRPWFETLEQGVRSGKVPFELEHGSDLYAYMDASPEFESMFAEAMDRVEALAGDSFATEFDWSRFNRLIDVGGSRGSKAVAILKRHPNLQALVIDRPQAIMNADEYWAGREGAECLSRMRFEAGDVLTSIPAAHDNRDVYLLCAVLHGFDDDTCVKALRTVAKAAAGTGAVIVVLEMVVPHPTADLTSASFDMQMFMGTKGKERTQDEWQQIFALSGVRLIEVVSLLSLGKMQVLRPKS